MAASTMKRSHGRADKPTSILGDPENRNYIHVYYAMLHHEMSRHVPDGHFHVFIFSESNSMLFTMVKTIFKSAD